jgi:hypothetical protein
MHIGIDKNKVAQCRKTSRIIVEHIQKRTVKELEKSLGFRKQTDNVSNNGYRAPPTMKTTTPPEPLYAFRLTNIGYSIAIIPATAADRTKFLANVRRRGMSLRDFCQDQIPDAMVFAEFET